MAEHICNNKRKAKHGSDLREPLQCLCYQENMNYKNSDFYNSDLRLKSLNMNQHENWRQVLRVIISFYIFLMPVKHYKSKIIECEKDKVLRKVKIVLLLGIIVVTMLRVISLLQGHKKFFTFSSKTFIISFSVLILVYEVEPPGSYFQLFFCLFLCVCLFKFYVDQSVNSTNYVLSNYLLLA